MYLVYILQCSDGSYYTGITNDIEHRLKMHNEGKGSKYVRSRLPFKIVYSESLPNKSIALRREIEIKKLSRIKKEQLVNKH